MERLYTSPKFKQANTMRGTTYRYYFSPATSNKPTLLFVHGFPSLSVHWINQITFFEKEGYGLVVPDMLGYGGTSIPREPEAYAHTLQAKDLIDILDAEKVGLDVIAIGHDWGSATVSRVANLYQDRFKGFAFLAVGYLPPNTELSHEQIKEQWAAAVGYVNIGYWSFFASPDAESLILKQRKSYYDISWSRSPFGMLKYNFCPDGALQNWLESESSTPRAPYLSKDDQKFTERTLTEGGWDGRLNYYRNELSNVTRESNRDIPLENYIINRPVLFIGTSQDPIAVPSLMEAMVKESCTNVTSTVIDSDHWAFWHAPAEVNSHLHSWLKGL